jgi:asparaginyl-tRNA synthetase
VKGSSQQQVVELRVDKVLHVGAVDIDKYPLSNVDLPSPELVKDYPQLVPRTTAVYARLACVVPFDMTMRLKLTF